MGDRAEQPRANGTAHGEPQLASGAEPGRPAPGGEGAGTFRRYSIYGHDFELPRKYIPGDPLGSGAYGMVIQATNTATNEQVAIKKIGNAFADKMDAKRTLREILLLRNMDHPNVMSLKDLIRPPNPYSFRDVYLVHEAMPTDLDRVIQSRQPLHERQFQFILYQLLKGIKYIHSANVLHRDLKPQNILIDGRCNIKITDFGLARTRIGDDAHLTGYVVTRYYRAPELLVNNQDYSAAVDVWSLGLIYLELVTGEILLKGHDYLDQLRRSCELVGSPTLTEVAFVDNKEARNYILNEIPTATMRPFTEVFPRLSPEGADLAERMLKFDPRQRISVDDALRHPYLATFFHAEQILTHTNPFNIELGFEEEEFDIQRIRQLIYEQSCIFYPDS